MNKSYKINRMLTYPFRLVRNGYQFLMKTGFRATIYKTLEVIKSWFGEKPEVHPITFEEYHNWIEKFEKSPIKGIELKIKPTISILMPVFNVKEEHLLEAVQSIKNQKYDKWELCMYDDASTETTVRPLLEKLASEDNRIKVGFSEKNEHISLNTNKAFSISTGEYLLLMDNDDTISEDNLLALVEAINLHNSPDIIYYDEDKLNLEGVRIEPYFKPKYNPEMLLETMYIVHALYSRSIFEKAGMLRKGFEGSQDYDLALRATELTDKIVHLPYILYHWRISETSTTVSIDNKPYVVNAAKQAIKEAISRRGYTGEVEGNNFPFRCKINVKGEPSVEIIIPTKDNLRYLKNCIKSIENKTIYKKYTITVVDNNSQKSETKVFFERLKENGHKVLQYNEKFNYSAINNFAAKQSDAEYLLFLNNDTEIIEQNWIEEMLRWGQMEGVGIVGAKLLYQDHFVQHAGIVLGMGPDTVDKWRRPVANHLYYREYDGNARQFNQLNMVQNVSAVTGACMMVRRSIFLQVSGFNEKELAVAFNDIDLCLRVYEAGYRTVYTPHARLYHFESKSRSPIPAEEETEYMYGRWKKYIESDIYYNPNFSRSGLHAYLLS